MQGRKVRKVVTYKLLFIVEEKFKDKKLTPGAELYYISQNDLSLHELDLVLFTCLSYLYLLCHTTLERFTYKICGALENFCHFHIYIMRYFIL